jgi:NAD(P)-dependent dehydrogenase (short-subunit alcohol dehydrogenase family)
VAVLFSNARLGKLELVNRILVAPMCQYSAVDGVAQAWHEMNLAVSRKLTYWLRKMNLAAGEVPLGRYGEMEELANLMILLLSDGCDYLTGETICIDGGHHLAAPSAMAASRHL